jgi:hypothetical protein
VRFVTICCTALAGLALAACGGSGSDTLDEDDLGHIAAAPSASPTGSSWRKRTEKQTSLAELRSMLRAQGRSTDVADAFERAGLTGDYLWEWVAGRGPLATFEARLFDDADGARQGFAAIQAITANWISSLHDEELGEEAVGGQSEAGAGYTWRRTNLVLTTSIYRGGGPAFDFARAARAYAHELDDRANAR